MNQEGIVAFSVSPTTNQLITKSDNKAKEKKGIFAVQSFQEPRTSNVSKRKKKAPIKKHPRNLLTKATHSSCSGIGLACTESNGNEMVCDTTSDDSRSEKSFLKEVTPNNTISNITFQEAPESHLSKSKFKGIDKKISCQSVIVGVPSFFNDRTKVGGSEANICQYSEICKKYLNFEDRDLYLVRRERINLACGCDVAKFDEDMFFNFDN